MTAVETWHKAKNDTFGAEVLRFPKVLPGHMGIVAVGLLTVIRTWCSENRTHIVPGHVVEALGRMYRLPDKTTGDILGALVTSHFLTKEANDVYHLTDISVIRVCANDETPAPSSRPGESTQRVRERNKKREQRAKAKGQASSVPDSSPTVPDVSPGTEAAVPTCPSNVPGVSPSVPGDNGAPPLSDSLPPARKQAQTQAQNPPPPPAGGAEPEQGGGQGSVSEAKGGSQPDLKTSPTPDAEEPSAEVEAMSSHQRYAVAYGEGISAATGRPFPGVRTLSELQALGAACGCAIDADKKLLRGEALLAWFREQAKAYATVRAGASRFERGFAPSKFLEWVTDPRDTTLSAGQAPRARGQQIVPQPADPGPFVPSFAPMTLDDLRAEKARQKEAAAAKAAGRLP